MSPPLVLILGGARSGKSRFAERLATTAGRHVSYIATAGPARDGEMATRIAAHVARRPSEWATIEAPLDVGAAIAAADGVVLVDCLTLWLTNVMLGERDIAIATDGLVQALAQRRGPVIAVANEVGEGIVPATPLGRAFRDAQGVLNQRIAAAATDVFLLVAGCPVRIKPSSDPEFSL